MSNSYKSRLQELTNREVVISRADTSELKGMLFEVDDDGCVIHQSLPGSLLEVFVAYEDIRGIGYQVPDTFF